MTEPFGRFFLPGPSEVHPEVLAAMQRPMIAHRSSECARLMEEVQPVLRELFGTTRQVLIGTLSATGFMEAGVRLIRRGKVLALVNGAFSERFALIAEACGHEVDRMEVEWGQAHDPDAVATRCADGDYVGVTVAHNETSTGVLQPVEALSRAAGDVPLLVDSTSGLGGAPLQFDAWNLGYALTGSQKALALPPGMAFAVVRDDLLARAEPGSFYLDLGKYADNPPPFTPALPQLYALAEQMERIEVEGVAARLRRHQRMAEFTAEWATSRGLRVLANRAHRSPTVTCVRFEDSTDLLKRLSARGYTVGNGYGKLKNQAFRIGHMGDQSLSTLERLLAVLAVEIRS